MEVLAYILTATGHIPREQTEAYLLRLYDTLQPQHQSFVWSSRVLAVALLGLETLSGVVRQAFGRGLIEPMVMDYDDFRRDLERTLADPERMAGFQHDMIGPLEDAIGELSGWYAFSDAAEQDEERWATVLRMFVCPLPTCPSRLLTRSRVSGGTIPAHAAAARSSRSAASIEGLCGAPRVCCKESAPQPGPISNSRSVLPRDAYF